ncbi:C-type lection lectoxin-Enh3-like [Paroedura picta]|uniref:C-type lection lectoxin-Enh3-like n=1 Tax=Paroedura picta TaxID=143630 RepID=UPI004057A728
MTAGESDPGTEAVGQMLSFSSFRIPLWGLLITICFLEAMSCPKGWLSSSNRCYGLFPDKVSRKEAEMECQSLSKDSHLASIISATEREEVIKYVTTSFKGVGNVWIGLRDRWRIRNWKWEDKSPANDFYWTSGAPSFFTLSKHCVYMIASEGYKTWKDSSCSETYAFLCKM